MYSTSKNVFIASITVTSDDIGRRRRVPMSNVTSSSSRPLSCITNGKLYYTKYFLLYYLYIVSKLLP